jgi:rhamnose utilization protein RhaD (predicted bifunctional aldolase and dehydrogenase)
MDWPAFDLHEDPLAALIKVSRYYGSDSEFVLAGGGNTSVKVGERLHVKASGRALAEADGDCFVALRRGDLQALLERDLGKDAAAREARFKESILAARVEPGRNQRPSVECVLHNLLPRRFVVHTHPTWGNMLVCSVDGERLAREWFGAEVLWLPYIDPGYTLARGLAEAL